MSTAVWVELWASSHSFIQGSPALFAYPDGQPLLEQDALLVAIFQIISSQWLSEQEKLYKNASK